MIDNRIVAKGHHREAGHAHAEINCLRDFAVPIPTQATLYVTLEPCSTAGRTKEVQRLILDHPGGGHTFLLTARHRALAMFDKQQNA